MNNLNKMNRLIACKALKIKGKLNLSACLNECYKKTRAHARERAISMTVLLRYCSASPLLFLHFLRSKNFEARTTKKTELAAMTARSVPRLKSGLMGPSLMVKTVFFRASTP